MTTAGRNSMSPEKAWQLVFSGLGAVLLIGSLIARHEAGSLPLAGHHPWGALLDPCGFECLMLALFFRVEDKTLALILLTAGTSALFTAIAGYALWNKLGSMAIVPGILLLLLACIAALLTRRPGGLPVSTEEI